MTLKISCAYNEVASARRFLTRQTGEFSWQENGIVFDSRLSGQIWPEGVPADRSPLPFINDPSSLHSYSLSRHATTGSFLFPSRSSRIIISSTDLWSGVEK